MSKEKPTLLSVYSFAGRATRAEFWLVSIATTLLGAGLMLYPLMRGMTFVRASPGDDWTSAVLLIAISLLPILAVTARRLHDFGYSGGWAALVFVLPATAAATTDLALSFGYSVHATSQAARLTFGLFALAGLGVLGFTPGIPTSGPANRPGRKSSLLKLLVVPASAAFVGLFVLRLGPVEATYQRIFGSPVSGLLVMEVDATQLNQEWLDTTALSLTFNLRDSKVIAFAKVEPDGSIQIRSSRDAQVSPDLVARELARMYPAVEFGQSEVKSTSDGVLVRLSDLAKSRHLQRAMDHATFTIRHRLANLGVWAPRIERIGDKRLIVEVPGVDDLTRVKATIAARGKLEVYPVKRQLTEKSRYVLPANEAFLKMPTSDTYILVKKDAIFSSSDVIQAEAARHFHTGEPVVVFTLNLPGSLRLSRFTSNNVGQSIAIVVDGTLLSAPKIQTPILAGRGSIAELTTEAATILATQLRSGPLPASFSIVEERVAGRAANGAK